MLIISKQIIQCPETNKSGIKSLSSLWSLLIPRKNNKFKSIFLFVPTLLFFSCLSYSHLVYVSYFLFSVLSIHAHQILMILKKVWPLEFMIRNIVFVPEKSCILAPQLKLELLCVVISKEKLSKQSLCPLIFEESLISTSLKNSERAGSLG